MAAADRYLFRSVWRLDAPADRVYAALQNVAEYPRWWREVREAVQLSDTQGQLRCRSLLPYDLTMVLTREIEDPVQRVLRARLEGDLIGVSTWTVSPANGSAADSADDSADDSAADSADDSACMAVFDEDVTVGKAAVRAAGRLARPVLTFNHDRMMRSGERGLRRWLGA